MVRQLGSTCRVWLLMVLLMRLPVLFSAVCAILVLTFGSAHASPRADAMLDAIQIGKLMEIMEAESAVSAADLDDSMLGGTGGNSWQRTVERINDADRMEREMREIFADHMPPELIDDAITFFSSAQGQKIINLELSAREVLLDPNIDQMNRTATREMRFGDSDRFRLILEFVEVNDLIDANVAGAMTGNVAFLRGLRGGGFPPYARASDAELVAEVWAREAELRMDTEEWVFAFLSLAYRPLSDNDLEAYIAFSETEAGQALNRALFAAMDKVFSKTSQALGEAVAMQVTAEEI